MVISSQKLFKTFGQVLELIVFLLLRVCPHVLVVRLSRCSEKEWDIGQLRVKTQVHTSLVCSLGNSWI